MENKSPKERTAVWLYPETIKSMDNLLEKDNCKSRSEFIDNALSFYIGYLVTESNAEYMSKTLISAMRGILKETENKNASNLFRLSVEMSMMMNLIAAGIEIDGEDLENLRVRCVQQVKKTKGKISVEDAVKFQNGIDE